jgi:hypothetical protein
MKTMTETSERPTAKIYQFPVKVRAGRTADQHGRRMRELPAGAAPVECGSGWYHDAAIAEAEQAARR